MAKLLLLLLAACFVPAIVTARFMTKPTFHVEGCVYCDTCRCGYETDASEYMEGATVKIVCHNKYSGKETYSKEGLTDKNGRYTIDVDNDFGEDVCEAVLVKSSNPECATPNKGRDRATVILTSNNGMTSSTRYANNMGFLKNTMLSNCAQILEKYIEKEEI